jgi:hypothetical protein
MRLRKHKLRNHGVSDRAPNRPKNDRIDPTLDIDKNTGWKKQYAMFAKLGYREKCLELRIDASLANLLKALKSTRELLTSRKYLDLSSALAPLSNGSSSVPLTHQVVHDIFKKTALNFVFLVEGVFPKSDFHPVHKLHSSVPYKICQLLNNVIKAHFRNCYLCGKPFDLLALHGVHLDHVFAWLKQRRGQRPVDPSQWARDWGSKPSDVVKHDKLREQVAPCCPGCNAGKEMLRMAMLRKNK